MNWYAMIAIGYWVTLTGLAIGSVYHQKRR